MEITRRSPQGELARRDCGEVPLSGEGAPEAPLCHFVTSPPEGGEI